MRAARRLTPALLLLLVLAGCPLASDVPLVDPAAALIDRALVGTWQARDPETGEAHGVTFQVFNDHEMVAFMPTDDGKGIDAYRVLAGPLGPAAFLSLRELGSPDSGWSIARYEVTGSTLVLSVLDDGLFAGRRFSTAADLAGFVRQNLDNPLLYAPAGETRQDMTFTRGSS